MDALQTVFDYILNILNIIKDFFTQLFPQKEEGTDESTEATA